MVSNLRNFLDTSAQSGSRLSPEVLTQLASHREFAVFAASTFELPLEPWKQAIQTVPGNDVDMSYVRPYQRLQALDRDKSRWVLLKAPARILDYLERFIPHEYWREVLGETTSKATLCRLVPRAHALALVAHPDKMAAYLDSLERPMDRTNVGSVTMLADDDFVKFAERSFFPADGPRVTKYRQERLSNNICPVLETRPHLVKALAGDVRWARYLLRTSHWDPEEVETLEKLKDFGRLKRYVSTHPNHPASSRAETLDDGTKVLVSGMARDAERFPHLVASTWIAARKASRNELESRLPRQWQASDGTLAPSVKRLANVEKPILPGNASGMWIGTHVAEELKRLGVPGIVDTVETAVCFYDEASPAPYRNDHSFAYWMARSPYSDRPPVAPSKLRRLPVDTQVRALRLLAEHDSEPEVWPDLLELAKSLAS